MKPRSHCAAAQQTTAAGLVAWPTCLCLQAQNPKLILAVIETMHDGARAGRAAHSDGAGARAGRVPDPALGRAGV